MSFNKPKALPQQDNPKTKGILRCVEQYCRQHRKHVLPTIKLHTERSQLAFKPGTLQLGGSSVNLHFTILIFLCYFFYITSLLLLFLYHVCSFLVLNLQTLTSTSKANQLIMPTNLICKEKIILLLVKIVRILPSFSVMPRQFNVFLHMQYACQSSGKKKERT